MLEAHHERLSDELRDRVAMYLLDGMPESEATDFEAHLGRCSVCRDEVERMKPTVGELVLSAPACDPPPGLRDRALALFRHARFSLQASPARGWLETDVPGVEMLPLWRDPERGRRTVLIRMRAGTRLPAHRHAGPEECTVIDGDLCEGSISLRAGHTMRKEPGSEHSVFTRNGCLLLLTASRRAERLSEGDGPR